MHTTQDRVIYTRNYQKDVVKMGMPLINVKDVVNRLKLPKTHHGRMHYASKH